MLSNLSQDFINVVAIIQYHMHWVLLLIAVLWLIHFINWLSGYRLNLLGIYPRHLFGLIGIVTAPFLHANFNHVFFNSIPLFALMCFVMINGFPLFIFVSMSIIILSGTMIWLFGRKAIHIGASALIMGYLGYLLMNVYYQGTAVAIGIGVVCIYYFAGLLLSIFPSSLKTSWEGHLFGLIAGIATSYLA